MLAVFTGAGFTTSRESDQGTVVLTLGTAPPTRTPRLWSTPGSSPRRRDPLRPLLHPKSVAVVGARSDGTGDRRTCAPVHGRRRLHGVRGPRPPAGSMSWPACRRTRPCRPFPNPSTSSWSACLPTGCCDVLEDAAAAGVRAAVIVSSGFGELGGGRPRAPARHGRARPGPRRAGRRPQLPRSALQPPRRPAQRHLQRHRAARRRARGGQPVRRRRHRAHGPRPRARARHRTPSSRWGTRRTSPATTCSRPGTPTPTSPRPRCTWSRSATPPSSRASRAGSPSGSPCSRSWAAARAVGSRAGASHTAAAATPAVGVDALFAQAGVIACRDAEDLARTALLLDRTTAAGRPSAGRPLQRRRHGRPRGRRRRRGGTGRPGVLTRPPGRGSPTLGARHVGHLQPGGRRGRRLVRPSWPRWSTPSSSRVRRMPSS